MFLQCGHKPIPHRSEMFMFCKFPTYPKATTLYMDSGLSRCTVFSLSCYNNLVCSLSSRSSAELLLKYDASTNIPDNSGKFNCIRRRKRQPRGEGVLGLLGMCRWMVLHFHDCTDYNGVVFSLIFNRVTRMGSHVFQSLRVKNHLPKSD